MKFSTILKFDNLPTINIERRGPGVDAVQIEGEVDGKPVHMATIFTSPFEHERAEEYCHWLSASLTSAYGARRRSSSASRLAELLESVFCECGHESLRTEPVSTHCLNLSVKPVEGDDGQVAVFVDQYPRKPDGSGTAKSKSGSICVSQMNMNLESMRRLCSQALRELKSRPWETVSMYAIDKTDLVPLCADEPVACSSQ